MRRLSSLVCLICTFSWLASSAFAQADRAATGTIQGRVTAGEKPLANISVGLIRVDRQSPTQHLTIASTTTDAEGRYRLTDVPAGNYQVSPLAPGYIVPGDKPNFPGQGRAITLSQGENIEKVDFALIRGGVITGKVLDPDGKPLIKQTVTLWNVDERGRKRERWSGSGMAGELR